MVVIRLVSNPMPNGTAHFALSNNAYVYLFAGPMKPSMRDLEPVKLRLRATILEWNNWKRLKRPLFTVESVRAHALRHSH